MVPYPHLIRVFLSIGLASFGGPAAQIGLMHRVLVEERKWLSEQHYLNALGFCMLLPGPEAMQLCTYAGWKLRGIPGGLIAGTLFVLPGATMILILAALYTTYGALPGVQVAFDGIKAAVIIIILDALRKMTRRALITPVHWGIAGCAFVAIHMLDVPFPLIIFGAALVGFAGAVPASFAQAPLDDSGSRRWPRSLAILGFGACLWLAPLLFLGDGLLRDVSLFFAWLAVVTFGGAYAVLAYMAQVVVTDFGWMSPEAMIDGLGMAEATPGPLILVTQFVAFLTGHGAGGMTLGVWAAMLSIWMTFIPCFIWIFAGAPFVDTIGKTPRLSAAMRAVTAAVVGVILNLSVWFILNAAFATVDRTSVGPLRIWWPDVSTLNPIVAACCGLSAWLLLRRNLGLGWVLGLSAVFALGLGRIV